MIIYCIQFKIVALSRVAVDSCMINGGSFNNRHKIGTFRSISQYDKKTTKNKNTKMKTIISRKHTRHNNNLLFHVLGRPSRYLLHTIQHQRPAYDSHYQPMLPNTRTILQKFLKPFNRELEILLDMTFWKKL